MKTTLGTVPKVLKALFSEKSIVRHKTSDMLQKDKIKQLQK